MVKKVHQSVQNDVHFNFEKYIYISYFNFLCILSLVVKNKCTLSLIRNHFV